MPDRLVDTVRFYNLIDRLTQRVATPRQLRPHGGLTGRLFLFEANELRSHRQHAVTAGSQSKLWTRLNQHKGIGESADANQRGSIFRKILGIALAKQDGIVFPKSWNLGSTSSAAANKLGITREQVRHSEAELGRLVSRYIRRMPFLWVNVDDPPSPSSDRAFIERNAIALLSGYVARTSDAPSQQWLGRLSDRDKVRRSGLWNNNHVDVDYSPSFLDALERHISTTHRP